MNLLLDTHALLWLLADDPGLAREARAAVALPANQVFVSAVSAWEIAIKKSLGKLRAPDDYLEALNSYRFTPLDITTEHALAVERLPRHHNDPFGRMLVSQAKLENLTIVTRDERISRYDVMVLAA